MEPATPRVTRQDVLRSLEARSPLSDSQAALRAARGGLKFESLEAAAEQDARAWELSDAEQRKARAKQTASEPTDYSLAAASVAAEPMTVDPVPRTSSRPPLTLFLFVSIALLATAAGVRAAMQAISAGQVAKAQVATLEAQMVTLEAQAVTLQSSLQSLREQAHADKRLLAAQQEAQRRAEDQTTSLQAQVLALQAQESALQAQVAALQAREAALPAQAAGGAPGDTRGAQENTDLPGGRPFPPPHVHADLDAQTTREAALPEQAAALQLALGEQEAAASFRNDEQAVVVPQAASRQALADPRSSADVSCEPPPPLTASGPAAAGIMVGAVALAARLAERAG